ncbi:histidinol-phosphate transaminase [Corynebacterium sp. SCR221107]|uniref:histidinol-phosphate transaminase n=1 Tax=Corynebacterium sp. SCR221107 TaxID=3017361 RepID=UPI0022EC87C7|nr:histidinol-phosphate transaminase [Corynebacterium sp. SCR221107]WBT08949.1 histidinol-phosphate transaminase [Corynebacterium sp. SCR221107]
MTSTAYIRPDLETLPSYVPGKRDDHSLKLSSNEVAFEPLDAAKEAMAAATAGANRYPDLAAVELRSALAEHLGLTLEQVAVGVGSSALCQQLVQITAGPGDEVVFPWRSFEAYPIFTQVTGATPVAVPLDAKGFNDLEAMAAAVNENTKLIFVCNPNNPSGTTITRADFDAFLASVPKHIIVALDEAYFEFNRDDNSPVATDYVRKHANVVGLRTFSKAYGLAGVRVGYAFGAAEIIDALNKVALPFGVNVAAQAGAIASLHARDELLARIKETVAIRDRVADHIGAAHSQANFIWLPTTPERSAEIASTLAAEGVIVRSFPEGVRITITNAAEMDVLIAAWDRAFA